MALFLELIIVDAFTSKPFRGNPAAVCLLGNETVLEECKKQAIATELNQSETAFVQPMGIGETFENAAEFRLQWFTPVMEVNLCGHATLAAAATLFEVKGNKNDSLVFHTKSGELVAKRRGHNVVINLPLNPCTTELPEGTDEIVKLAVGSVPPIDVQYAPKADTAILIHLPDSISKGEFESISPDLAGLTDVYNRRGAPGVILTVRGSTESGCVDEDGRCFDFLSRNFDPWNGVPEDPVTARQCSERGGNIEIAVLDENRVELSGGAYVIFKGTISL